MGLWRGGNPVPRSPLSSPSSSPNLTSPTGGLSAVFEHDSADQPSSSPVSPSTTTPLLSSPVAAPAPHSHTLAKVSPLPEATPAPDGSHGSTASASSSPAKGPSRPGTGSGGGNAAASPGLSRTGSTWDVLRQRVEGGGVTSTPVPRMVEVVNQVADFPASRATPSATGGTSRAGSRLNSGTSFASDGSTGSMTRKVPPMLGVLGRQNSSKRVLTGLGNLFPTESFLGPDVTTVVVDGEGDGDGESKGLTSRGSRSSHHAAARTYSSYSTGNSHGSMLRRPPLPSHDGEGGDRHGGGGALGGGGSPQLLLQRVESLGRELDEVKATIAAMRAEAAAHLSVLSAENAGIMNALQALSHRLDSPLLRL